jgi:hypothetical protein
MLNSYELAKAWFPGARKEVVISAVSLLETKAGEKRIKLGLVLPLCDGKLVGMSTQVAEALEVIQREESHVTAVKLDIELKEMTMTIFNTEDSQKPAQIAVAPLITAMSVRRNEQEEEDEELSDVNLHMFAYIGATTQLWSWFYQHFRMSMFVRFETTQSELPLSQPAPDTQMKLGEDGYEAARREATSKDHDAEFAQA